MKTNEVGVAPSPTGDMENVYEGTRDCLASMISELGEVEAGQTGVIACVGGRPVALECFDRPETFAHLWSRLLRGYAMEALEGTDAAVDEGAVRLFVAQAASARATVAEGIGLGSDVALVGPAVVGNALVWDDHVVHLAIFGNERGRHSGAIEGPTARRRLRFG